jgi:hypothetical protein
MVGASFTVAAAAEVIRKKTSILSAGSTVSTTQSKFGGSSATFNGSSQYINVPHQTQLDISAYSNWTIECWSRLTDGTSRTILNKDGIAGSVYPGYTFYTNGSKQVTFGVGGSAGNWITVTRSTALADNTWYHLAAVKNGSTVTFYVDGVSAGTATFVGYTDQSRSLYIGWESSGTYMYGYLDEVRISNSARYTTTFTSSTTAFVNDANTVFLMHADGTNASTFFEDDNGVRASRSLIAIGNAQVDTAQSKFGGSALLLDGTGDYLLGPAGTQWDFGTGSFTIEYFIRFNAINTLYVPIALRPTSGIGNGEWWCEITAAENKMYWGFKNYAGTQYYVNLSLAGTAFATGQWYHIALVNNAGTAQLYVNGTATGTTTALSGSFGISTSDLQVGAGAGAYSLNGWMDEVRISNTARYTTTFTPSTTPFVNDANTLLLVHADGTDASTVFRDDNGARAPKGIVAIGNAQIDTAQSKFSGSSLLLDGTDDRLEIYPTTTYTDFTVECWIRLANNSGTKNILSFGNESSGRVFFAVYSDRIYWDEYGVTSRYGNTSMSANTWYHLAWSRTGSTIKLFVDGVEQTMTTVSGSGTFPSGAVGNTNGIFVGTLSDGAIDFNGHIDEIRISNSVRYTTGFTAPTAPFQNDANTLLLLHMDGSDASTAFFDDNGVSPTHSYS